MRHWERSACMCNMIGHDSRIDEGLAEQKTGSPVPVCLTRTPHWDITLLHGVVPMSNDSSQHEPSPASWSEGFILLKGLNSWHATWAQQHKHWQYIWGLWDWSCEAVGAIGDDGWWWQSVTSDLALQDWLIFTRSIYFSCRNKSTSPATKSFI